ncbi:MAG: transcription antitermination factor NusB [Spirochaetaceae bacterium]
MGSRRKSRVLALQALYSWDFNKNPVEELINFSWLDQERRSSYDEQTLNFAALLVRGTLEEIETIDLSIKNQLEHWDFSRLAKVDLAILRVSIYSLIYQKDIPHTVTIDEAIDLAKMYGNDDSYRFVNGVLDGLRKRL